MIFHPAKSQQSYCSFAKHIVGSRLRSTLQQNFEILWFLRSSEEMFPIYQSLYKHLPLPLFPPPPHASPHGGGQGGKTPETLMDGNLFMAAAAAAMEQVAAASKLEPSSLEEESLGSPSPPVDRQNQIAVANTTATSKPPFLKFSVSAILSKAKEEIQEDEAVKSSDGKFKSFEIFGKNFTQVGNFVILKTCKIIFLNCVDLYYSVFLTQF